MIISLDNHKLNGLSFSRKIMYFMQLIFTGGLFIVHKKVGIYWVIILFFIVCFSVTTVQAWTGNLNILLGSKTLDEDYWAPAEEQETVGIQFNFKKDQWPVHLAIEYNQGSGNGIFYHHIWLQEVKVESDVMEVDIGVKKIWDTSPMMRPFLGLGGSFIKARLDLTNNVGIRTDSENTLGIWIGGGIYWTLVNNLNLGFDVKVSFGNVMLYGINTDVGSGQSALLFGYHW